MLCLHPAPPPNFRHKQKHTHNSTATTKPQPQPPLPPTQPTNTDDHTGFSFDVATCSAREQKKLEQVLAMIAKAEGHSQVPPPGSDHHALPEDLPGAVASKPKLVRIFRCSCFRRATMG